MKHKEEEYKLYFGKEADYYLDVLKKIDLENKTPFNFHAALLGAFWILYRKMYRELLLLLVLIYIESYFEEYILFLVNANHSSISIVYQMSLFLWIGLIGLFSNKLYINKANREITQIKRLGLSSNDTNKKIESTGGTTFVPHFILLTLIVLIVFLGKQGYFN
ncbi:DUF2628 domain-containing protein [uncultured Tenacibaculum sp.]|uniref:DUF2628 domain-containing protein n=1 Tax=uncultured Tenacibaculum sp. TaxID=174713 RepID=UPI002601FD35|nr:DUF2628 domain-containing protein [uncultured Tenacibaculum sp.]